MCSFTIDSVLGRGSQGIVYKAQDNSSGDNVVLKFIPLKDYGAAEKAKALKDRLKNEELKEEVRLEDAKARAEGTEARANNTPCILNESVDYSAIEAKRIADKAKEDAEARLKRHEESKANKSNKPSRWNDTRKKDNNNQ